MSDSAPEISLPVECPGCGTTLTGSRFLCNRCSNAAADELVVAAGAAIDGGDQAALDEALQQVADTIGG